MTAIPELEPWCGSWIVTDRDTGDAVCELHARATAGKVNRTRYRVKTAYGYLTRINRERKEPGQ